MVTSPVEVSVCPSSAQHQRPLIAHRPPGLHILGQLIQAGVATRQCIETAVAVARKQEQGNHTITSQTQGTPRPHGKVEQHKESQSQGLPNYTHGTTVTARRRRIASSDTQGQNTAKRSAAREAATS